MTIRLPEYAFVRSLLMTCCRKLNLGEIESHRLNFYLDGTEAREYWISKALSTEDLFWLLTVVRR